MNGVQGQAHGPCDMGRVFQQGWQERVGRHAQHSLSNPYGHARNRKYGSGSKIFRINQLSANYQFVCHFRPRSPSLFPGILHMLFAGLPLLHALSSFPPSVNSGYTEPGENRGWNSALGQKNTCRTCNQSDASPPRRGATHNITDATARVTRVT